MSIQRYIKIPFHPDVSVNSLLVSLLVGFAVAASVWLIHADVPRLGAELSCVPFRSKVLVAELSFFFFSSMWFVSRFGY